MIYKYSTLLLFCVRFIFAQYAPIVNTTQGLIRGVEADDGDYFMYLGIPYAKVDPDNQFGSSSPGPAFEGIFNATDDSALCPQINNGVVLGSLACLHLNVFVPSGGKPQNLPVLVFVHGGAFELGSFGTRTYGPKFLIRHGIILVSINYRLGVYGFMCTDNPRVPGNQAFKDQLIALRWVHENIENFGGDPNKVTLSGTSAGAMMSDLHIIRGSQEKLFQQAILQSGVSFFPSFPPTVRNSPLLLARHFGNSTDDIDAALDFLATIQPLQILTAGIQLRLQFRPCIERSFNGVESFMTENWVSKEVIPTAKDLNILIGFNENEAFGLFLRPSSDLSNIVNQSLRETYAIEHANFSGSEEVRHFFFGDDVIDESKFKDAIDLRSDTSFVYTSMRSLKRYLKSEVGKMYLYLFSYDGERNLVKMRFNTTLEGAAHGDEIGYLFDVSSFDEPTVEDQLTIDRMTEMWTKFVKYGHGGEADVNHIVTVGHKTKIAIVSTSKPTSGFMIPVDTQEQVLISAAELTTAYKVVKHLDPTPELTEVVPVKWQAITPTSPHHYMHIGSALEAGTSPYNDRMAFWDLFHESNKHLQNFILDNAEFN